MKGANMKLDTQPEPTTTGPSDEGFLHTVDLSGPFRLLLDVTRLKIPRALCGVLLVGDPDKPEPFNLPPCPACAAREA
jgi:hypothetical protein